MLLALDENLTGPEAEALLLRTARDLGPPGPDMDCGHGLLDLPAAIAALQAGRTP